MAPEILAIELHHLLRHHGTIFHAEDAQYRIKRRYQLHLKSAVIHRRKRRRSIYPCIEYPGPAAGRPGIDDPVKAVYYIRRHHTAPLAARESFIVMKKNIRSKMKGPGLLIFRHIPAPGQGGHDMQLVIRLHKGIVKLMDRPHRAAVFGKCRVQGSYAILFIVPENLL